MQLGYARVSTSDQNPDLQVDALKGQGCEKVFVETSSGAKAERVELNKLLDKRMEGITQFAKNYGSMTDRQATDLARLAFSIEGKRTDLKRKYFKKFSKVITPLKAARFFQIENQINKAACR